MFSTVEKKVVPLDEEAKRCNNRFSEAHKANQSKNFEDALRLVRVNLEEPGLDIVWQASNLIVGIDSKDSWDDEANIWYYKLHSVVARYRARAQFYRPPPDGGTDPYVAILERKLENLTQQRIEEDAEAPYLQNHAFDDAKEQLEMEAEAQTNTGQKLVLDVKGLTTKWKNLAHPCLPAESLEPPSDIDPAPEAHSTSAIDPNAEVSASQTDPGPTSQVDQVQEHDGTMDVASPSATDSVPNPEYLTLPKNHPALSYDITHDKPEVAPASNTSKRTRKRPENLDLSGLSAKRRITEAISMNSPGATKRMTRKDLINQFRIPDASTPTISLPLRSGKVPAFYDGLWGSGAPGEPRAETSVDNDKVEEGTVEKDSNDDVKMLGK
ncbi:hypothetical protein BT63DRAFT_440923 [Microthyrium microscopicum]|uniref:Uncharacterized protein n=1 Tax=Microthyrium microscopicum TaxID=703497 RepID=A0A6A6U9B7_9PEZI|nr:hypothetical protein BT63DRAFT_440923 [Microthyrium microscopicum]